MHPVSAREYAAYQGAFCPVCRAHSIHDHEPRPAFAGHTVMRERMCLNCAATWQEVYGLKGYTALRVPIPPDQADRLLTVLLEHAGLDNVSVRGLAPGIDEALLAVPGIRERLGVLWAAEQAAAARAAAPDDDDPFPESH